MKTNNYGIQLIKKFEGLRLQAYTCPAGIPTIGYGHTTGVKSSDIISEKQADNYLLEDIRQAEQVISRYVKVPLSSNQFSALASFIFNIGITHFRSSTLLKKLNEGDYDGASEEFSRWVFVKGKQSQGLVRRRTAEKELFLAKAISYYS